LSEGAGIKEKNNLHVNGFDTKTDDMRNPVICDERQNNPKVMLTIPCLPKIHHTAGCQPLHFFEELMYPPILLFKCSNALRINRGVRK